MSPGAFDHSETRWPAEHISLRKSPLSTRTDAIGRAFPSFSGALPLASFGWATLAHLGSLVAEEFPSPTSRRSSRNEVFSQYLDYFRRRVIAKTCSLPPEELASSRLPSGWTPLELLSHLRHVERRWLVWGFEGERIEDPWADHRDDRWHVDPATSLEELVEALTAQGEKTTQVLASHELEEVGAPGERWEGMPPATLERICLHLLQEYARHLGHLDIVSELAFGAVGE